MNKLENNYFIKLLKIGFDAGDAGISINEVYDMLLKLGYFQNSCRKTFLSNWANGDDEIARDIPIELYKHWKEAFHFEPRVKDILYTKCSLKLEYVSRYLEYIELKEARQASKDALDKADQSIKKSKVAIRISIIVMIITIIIGVITVISDWMINDKQINTPITIHENSLRELKSILQDK